MRTFQLNQTRDDFPPTVKVAMPDGSYCFYHRAGLDDNEQTKLTRDCNTNAERERTGDVMAAMINKG